jgi:hypothetical protein
MKDLSMSEPASSTVAGIALAKLAPAFVGAAVMVAVGPKTITRREVFLRAAVGMALSYLFGDLAVSYLSSQGWQWFVAEKHQAAVLGFIGAFGWGFVGGLDYVARKFKRDPFGTAGRVRRAIRGEE